MVFHTFRRTRSTGLSGGCCYSSHTDRWQRPMECHKWCKTPVVSKLHGVLGLSPEFHQHRMRESCCKKKNFPNIGIYWPLASIRLQFYFRPSLEKCVFSKPSALFEQICSNFRSSFYRAFGSLQPPRLDHRNNPKQCFCKMSSNLFPTLTIYPIMSYHYRCGSCGHFFCQKGDTETLKHAMQIRKTLRI